MKQNRLLIITFSLLFVALLLWVGVSVSESQKQTLITAEMEKIAQPLTPTLNKDVFPKLLAEIYYSTEDLASFPIYVIFGEGENRRVVTLDNLSELADEANQEGSPAPTPAASPLPLSSPSARPAASPAL